MDLSLDKRIERVREGTPDVRLAQLDRVLQRLMQVDAAAATLGKDGARVDAGTALALNVAAMETWTEHVQLREMVTPTSAPETRQALRLSWIAVARSALLAQLASDASTDDGRYLQWPACFLDTAEANAYVAAVNARYQLIMSNQPIGLYSARLVFLALRVLVEVLDLYGWTPAAGAYLRALFLRYAMYLHAPEAAPAAYEDDGGELVATAPNDMDPLIPPPPPLPLAPGEEGGGGGLGLTTSFLDEGERLLFHHLWRSRALEHSLAHPRPLSIRKWGGAPAPAALRARFAAALVATLTHDLLRDSVVERVQQQAIDVFVWPGEREHMRFVLTDEDDDASSTLYRLRSDTYTRIQGALRKAMPVHVRDWAVLAPPADWEAGATARQMNLERLILVAFIVAVDQELLSHHHLVRHALGTHAYDDNRAMDPPTDRPPYTPAAARQAIADRWPLLLATWGCYVVQVHVPAAMGGTDAYDRCFCTPRLEEAAAVWLATVLAQGFVARDHLPPEWLAVADTAAA